MMTMFMQIGLWVAVALPGSPQVTRGLIEQALDEPTRITLEDITLRDAIAVITEQTGVKIVMPLEVMGFVPHGPETVIEKVSIADMPLRQGLTDLFSPLGMMFVVQDGLVEIVPKGALLCLGRPATWAELDTLFELSAMQPGVDEQALAILRSRVQFQLRVRDPWPILQAAIRDVGVGPGDQVLTVACANLGWAWCLSDRQLAIGSVENLIRRQLQQPVNLRMNNRPLIDILQALGGLIHTPVRLEPGALQMLPLNVQRSFSVNAFHQSAEQVLDQISAYTGLGYLINPEGVLFYAPGSADPPGPVARIDEQDAASFQADPYVGKLVVPLSGGASVEWLIRRSELPDDLRSMREEALREAFEALRRQVGTQAP